MELPSGPSTPPPQGLEGLLQENLRLPPQQGLNLGWGEDLEGSREFLPVVGGRSPPGLPTTEGEREEREEGGAPPMPRITIRLVFVPFYFHILFCP